MITRRSLIAGFATLLAAPAIVRASSLMPVRVFVATRRPKFRIFGTDAHGNYVEEVVFGNELDRLQSLDAYHSVSIELCEPIIIPKDAAARANFYAALAG
jgi:hypothetical protein